MPLPAPWPASFALSASGPVTPLLFSTLHPYHQAEVWGWSQLLLWLWVQQWCHWWQSWCW